MIKLIYCILIRDKLCVAFVRRSIVIFRKHDIFNDPSVCFLFLLASVAHSLTSPSISPCSASQDLGSHRLRFVCYTLYVRKMLHTQTHKHTHTLFRRSFNEVGSTYVSIVSSNEHFFCLTKKMKYIPFSCWSSERKKHEQKNWEQSPRKKVVRH